MPNFFSAFTTDVFRPLATLLIPGAVGIGSWFLALLWKFPALKELVVQNHTETGFGLLPAMLFAGMVLEDFGARWEDQLDRWADKRTNNIHSENWRAYLQTSFKSDPVGRRYARDLVLRLKFELGVAAGMISAGLGVLWLVALGLSWRVFLCSILTCLLFAAWGLLESKETHKVLSKTRATLLENVRVVA
jgi:hypothetical protein